MSKRRLAIAAAVFVVAVAGIYIRQAFVSSQSCISYFDKNGAKLLYKDCDTNVKL